MTTSTRPLVPAALVVAVLAGCLSDGSQSETPDDETVQAPEVSVTAPAQRSTPFCETMIQLSDRLLTDDVDDAGSLIIETYRSILPEVPTEIQSDFETVLLALETGAPVPTDPPRPTIATTVPPAGANATSTTTTTIPTTTTDDPPPTDVTSTSPDTAATTVAAPDVGYADGGSPSERINNYVSFACRSSQNNPGPPATPPLQEPPVTTP